MSIDSTRSGVVLDVTEPTRGTYWYEIQDTQRILLPEREVTYALGVWSQENYWRVLITTQLQSWTEFDSIAVENNQI